MNAHVAVSEADLALARREAGRGWTAHRIKVVETLFNGGMSAAGVASLIGGVTRNAVIGKIHRGGLATADRKPPQYTNRRGGAAVDETRKPRRERSFRPAARSNDEPPPPLVVDLEIPLDQRRTLLQLDSACCRWPVGDPAQPGFFFCGATKKADKAQPYCPSHMRRAHDPAGRRRNPDVAAHKSRISSARVNDVYWR